MIEKARARGLYDELHVAEAEAALRQWPLRFDAIVAADVLLYFGELAPLLAAAAAALRPAGIFAFSIETDPDPARTRTIA